MVELLLRARPAACVDARANGARTRSSKGTRSAPPEDETGEVEQKVGS